MQFSLHQEESHIQFTINQQKELTESIKELLLLDSDNWKITCTEDNCECNTQLKISFHYKQVSDTVKLNHHYIDN